MADVFNAEHLLATAPTSMLRPLQNIITIALVLVSFGYTQDAVDGSWAHSLERDNRVSFTPRTEMAAMTALNGGGLDLGGRAAALFALGASGSTRVRPTLEDAVATGNSRDRCAAVLGLGEIGVGVRELLEGLRDDRDPLVSECALLALMRTGRWSAAEYVEAVAESGDGARAEMAGQLLLFATDAPASDATAAAELLLGLRWRAAQSYGLIDGVAWSVRLIEDLSSNSSFIKSLTLKAAASVDRAGVKDCYLAIVGTEQSKGTLQASLRAMPAEFSKIVAAGLWVPAGRKQWNVLLAEIHSSSLESETRELLAVAAEVDSIRYRAISLLVRGGDLSLAAGLPAEMESGDLGVDQLAWCCDALGGSGHTSAVKTLRSLSEHESKVVAWAALVGMARLGDQAAVSSLRASLAGDDLSSLSPLIQIMNRRAGDALLSSLLTEALPRMEVALAMDTAISLVAAGKLSVRESLREYLSEGVPTGAVGARAILALATDMSREDIAFVRHQFPVEGDPIVNEALALVLYELRDPVVMPLIRASVWGGSFDESLLASALMMEISGASVLFDEIDRAPLGCTKEDVRRVGYALGLWGGIPALRELTTKLRSGDPALQGALLGALASRTH